MRKKSIYGLYGCLLSKKIIIFFCKRGSTISAVPQYTNLIYNYMI